MTAPIDPPAPAGAIRAARIEYRDGWSALVIECELGGRIYVLRDPVGNYDPRLAPHVERIHDAIADALNGVGVRRPVPVRSGRTGTALVMLGLAFALGLAVGVAL